MATAPDFGGDSAPSINVDEIMFSMDWPQVPIRQMESDQNWWEQIPKDNMTIRVIPKNSDEVEQMFPEFCNQNRNRPLAKDQGSKSGGWFGGSKKKKETSAPILTNAMDVVVAIKNPQGVNDLVLAMNSAVVPGPAILSFRVEGGRDYNPTHDAESWKLLAAMFRKCYPQCLGMEKIEITGQDIGEEALIFLASSIGHYPRLHTVDLWDNKISGRGATDFVKVATKNKNIKTINLGKNILDMNAKTDIGKLAKDFGIDVDTY